MLSTNSRGLRPLSEALVNSSAAPSSAPPKREPMVSRPDTSALIRSLPARRGDDGVHGARHGRAVVGREHEHHLEELGGVVGQAAAEPQQRHDAADADVLAEHVRDGHAGVQELLAAVVRDGGDEGGRLADEAELLGPRVVDGDLGHGRLGRALDGTGLDQLVVDGLEHGRHLLERVGHEEAGVAPWSCS